MQKKFQTPKTFSENTPKDLKSSDAAPRAFSLIELSIVILIIGIIISGITSATRLVYQFRINSARSLTSSSAVNSIAGLLIWFETTSEKSFADSEESDGVQVTTWYDINPHNQFKYSLVQNISSNKPTYIAKGQSAGLPVLQSFSTPSSVQRMSTSANLDLTNNPSFTIFIVASASNGGGSQSQIFSIGDISGACTQFSLNYWGSNTGNLQFNGGDKTFDMNSSNMLALFRIVRYGDDAGSSTVNGSTTRLNFNGSSKSVDSRTSSDCVPALASAPFSLTKAVPASSTTLTVQFGEIIIFNRVLKPDEITDIEAYLSKKWSIKLI